MEVYCRSRGSGAPLMMLHGLFGSGDNLGGLVRTLEDDFKMYLPDHRNHGRSPHVPGNSYREMATDILELMDKEGIERAHFYGHSMGGKISMQLAVMAPERVDHMVIGDISPVAYGRHHDGILEGMAAVAAAAPQSRKGAEDVLAPFIRENGVLSFLLTNWRRATDGEWRWRLNLDAITKDYHQIAAEIEGAAVKVPILFLRGGNSDYVTADHREKILALFPDATVRTVEGTGHWLHAEKPELVGRLIKRFLIEHK